MEGFKHKAFLSALILINTESRKAKQFLNDKRMTFQEKTLVASFLALRDFENEEVIQVLLKMICKDPFVETQRQFCLGAAYNNLTQFEEAKIHLLNSIHQNKFQGAEVLRFAACQSLFTVYLNLHDKIGMSEMITLMKKDKKFLESSPLHIEFCEFSHSIQCGDFKNAEKRKGNLEKNYENLNEHQKMSYLYDLFDFYFYQELYTKAENITERMKLLKKYKNATHVTYMKTLISFLSNGNPLYLYEKDYIKYPLLFNQLLCLKALECGDEIGARGAWSMLQQLDPLTCKEPFQYLGPPNLFSKTLEKLLSHQFKKVEMVNINPLMKKEEMLLTILSSSSLPMSKETLYQSIWSEQLNSKDDLMKLAKLVQRAKEKYGIEIKSVKGSYVLMDKKAA